MSNVDIGAVGNKNIGAVQESGGAPIGEIFNIPLGTLDLNGVAPTFAVTENHFFLIPLGTLSLDGFAPDFSEADNLTFQIPLGSIDLNGRAPRFNDGAVTLGTIKFFGEENEII